MFVIRVSMVASTSLFTVDCFITFLRYKNASV